VIYRSGRVEATVGSTAMRMPDHREGELPEKLEPDDDPIDEVVDLDHLEAQP
jgi:hypothetical protein